MLRYHADTRTIVFAGLCLASYVIQWKWRMLDAEPWALTGLWMVMTSLQAFQQAVSVHNVCHVKPSAYPMVNHLLSLVLTLLSGAPASLYIPGHNETHHRAPESEIDMLRTTKVAYGKEWLNLLFFFPTVLPGIVVNDFRYMQKQKLKRTALYRQYLIETLALNAIILSLAYIDMTRTLIVYFLPTLFGKNCIVSLNYLQHGKCDVSSTYNGARNFTGPILNYFLFDNGYHQAHHMFPGLHWSLIRKKHESIKHHIHPELLQENILAYIYSVVTAS